MRSLAVLLALAATAGIAIAQEPGGAPAGQPRVAPARGPETTLALEAAQTATMACTTNGYKLPPATSTRMKTDPALAAKINADADRFGRAGGIPLMAGGEVIGAIGVGGAPAATRMKPAPRPPSTRSSHT